MRTTIALLSLPFLAVQACTDPGAIRAPLDAGIVADAVWPTTDPTRAEPAPAPPRERALEQLGVRSPHVSRTHLACRTSAPAGPCDRCPECACRQVRTTLDDDLADSSWAMFCEEGDLVEEARIACLCSGGRAAICERAAYETTQALFVLREIFGGDVPVVGTRYRDSNGLAAVVDDELHTWLARAAGPAPTLRCDTPDREAVARDYQRDAQRVRTTGRCH